MPLAWNGVSKPLQHVATIAFGIRQIIVVFNVARASSGTQIGKLIRLIGVLGTALLLAPLHVSDAEAGQETRLSAGRPIRVVS